MTRELGEGVGFAKASLNHARTYLHDHSNVFYLEMFRGDKTQNTFSVIASDSVKGRQRANMRLNWGVRNTA